MVRYRVFFSYMPKRSIAEFLVDIFSAFCRTSTLISTVAVTVYTPASGTSSLNVFLTYQLEAASLS